MAGLIPFWFRAGGVAAKGGVLIDTSVLIPFGSGLGGLCSRRVLRRVQYVLIPFGSGLGGLNYPFYKRFSNAS